MLIGVPLNGVSIGIREIFAGGIVKRRSLDTRWMVVVAVVVGSDRVQDSAQCRARRYNCTNEFTSKSICKSAAIVNHFNAKSVMHRPTSLQDVLHYDRTLNKNYEDPVLWQVSLVTAMTLNRQRFSLDARYVLVRLSLDGLSESRHTPRDSLTYGHAGNNFLLLPRCYQRIHVGSRTNQSRSLVKSVSTTR